MQLLWKLGIGISARFLGMLAEHFAQWVFHEVSEGAETACESLSDLLQFGRWFLKMLAGQLCGRSRPRFEGYGGEFHPDYYGAQ